MTTDRQIELIDELADKCCRDHDIHKSCMACWRRTQGCSKYITLAKLVQEGCRLVPKGKWKIGRFERSVCSVCGATFDGDGGNYCCICGARMTED